MGISVLHITPHFGGGVGTVLTKLIRGLNNIPGFHHEIVSLEFANDMAKKWSLESGIKIYESISPYSQWLHTKMENTDIVQIHFWNHPALFALLHNFSGKIARIVMWAHVNGIHAPYLFNNSVLEFPDIFVTSSDYSLNESTIMSKSDKWKEQHISSIHSTAGVSKISSVDDNKKHKGFTVGYIGTVDYVKMHRDIISIFSDVNIPDCKFIICGGDKQIEIEAEAREKGVANKFKFLGKISNVKEMLSNFDIFAYPLNRNNYGTGEQVLIEAMSAGVPQVVFGNGPEEYVISNNVTGLVVSSNHEFTKAIEKIYKDRALRLNMSEKSIDFASKHYGINQSINLWVDVYNRLISSKPIQHLFKTNNNDDNSSEIGINLFLRALGDSDEKQLFLKALEYYPNKLPTELQNNLQNLPPVFLGKTRGSVNHYNSFFEDKKLKYLSEKVGINYETD